MEAKCKNCKHYAIMDKSEASLCTLFLDKVLSDKRMVCYTSPGNSCEMFEEINLL